MKYSTGLLSALMAWVFLLSGAAAEEGKGEKQDKLTKALAHYQKTGKLENCITTYQIDSSNVIDDQNILFKMHGKKAYLNHLTTPCAGLGFNKSFSYKTSLNQLCNVDVITVLDTTTKINGPSCGLGKFEEYEKISREENK